MPAQRSIFVTRAVRLWFIGMLIPFRWDHARGEFAGFIEVTGQKPNGEYTMKFHRGVVLEITF